MIHEPKPVQEQEIALLEFLEAVLTVDFAQPGFERLARLLAQSVTDDDRLFAQGSRHHPAAWLIMQAAVAHLREQGPEAIRDAVGGPVLEWALDVAEGTLDPPKKPRGRDPLALLGRDAVIAAFVAAIHDLRYRPVKASDKTQGGSVCHLVADRLEISYETVCRIWQKHGHSVRTNKSEKS